MITLAPTCERFGVSPVQAMIEAAPKPQCLDEIIVDMHKLPGLPLVEVLDLPPLSDAILAFMFPGESTHLPPLYTDAAAIVPLPAGLVLLLSAVAVLALFRRARA